MKSSKIQFSNDGEKLWVIKNKEPARREKKWKPYLMVYKNESMSIIFVCCITENLIKIILAQLKMIQFKLPLLFAPTANQQRAQKANYRPCKCYKRSAIIFLSRPINHWNQVYWSHCFSPLAVGETLNLMSYAHGTIIYTESYSPREKGKHKTILSANVRKLQLFFLQNTSLATKVFSKDFVKCIFFSKMGK